MWIECKVGMTFMGNFALMNLQVTWVEHSEYEENQVHQLYRPLLSSGMGFGASRWVATLQRQCECLAILMSSAAPSRDHSGITLTQLLTSHNTFATQISFDSLYKFIKISLLYL